jgi:hypothetical protein
MLVAADLMRSDKVVLKWLTDTKDIMALIGGIMSVVQPELFSIGRQALEQLANHKDDLLPTQAEELLEVLEQWWAPFNGITVISNRQTPLHRDLGGRPGWSDLLVALGKYQHGRFELPGLGLIYRYNPGTMICFAGSAFEHGANCNGDRACIAFYMKDNIMKRLGLPIADWLNVGEYQSGEGAVQ